MKLFIQLSIIVLLIFSSCAEKQNKIDCSKVKTGKFEFRGGFKEKHFSIDRNDSIQIEKDPDTGFGMKFKIDWNGSCEYKLTPIAFIVNGKDSVIENSEKKIMNTKILVVTYNYYVCQSMIEGKSDLFRDTMVIVR